MGLNAIIAAWNSYHFCHKNLTQFFNVSQQ